MTVGVYGATGFTGRLVVEELRRQGLPTRAVARSAERLDALAADWSEAADPPLDLRVADAGDPASVRAALEGLDVVIACAGPFTDVGEAALLAALDADAHYLDSTGEQGFLLRTEELAGKRARTQDLAVVNAMAFEVALSDMAASLAARGLGRLDDLRVAYALAGGGTSRGTRLSMLRAAEAPQGWRGGRRVSERLGAVSGPVRFPSPPGTKPCVGIPGAELITIPRHVDTVSCSCVMALPAGLALGVRACGGLLPTLLRTPVGGWLRRAAGGGSPGPDLPQRQRAHFTILVEAIAGDRYQRVVLRGLDPYGLTAAILVRAARGLLEGEDSGARGVLSPSQLFEARAFLASLEEQNLTVDLCGGQVEGR